MSPESSENADKSYRLILLHDDDDNDDDDDDIMTTTITRKSAVHGTANIPAPEIRTFRPLVEVNWMDHFGGLTHRPLNGQTDPHVQRPKQYPPTVEFYLYPTVSTLSQTQID